MSNLLQPPLPMRFLQLLASASMLMPLISPQLTAGLQCLDTDGQPLDWFAMLKQPGKLEYAYASSRSPSEWIQPSIADLEASGPLYQTISQVLPTSAPFTGVLAAYNDESPFVGDSSNFGHMKGVVALKADSTGFWLIHSVPKFPDFNSSAFSFPSTGLTFGQSFLCITVLSNDAAEAIGRQLFTAHPNIYKLNLYINSTTMVAWPSWVDLAEGKRPPAQLLNTSAQLVTPAGLPVLHVAKSHHLEQDLYAHVLTSQLDSSIQVESWRHGSNLLNSTCGTLYNVTTILDVRIANLTDFPSTKDHSKWCVGAGSRPYVCIGDMNRAVSQFKRGGGIACLSLPGLHRLFKAAVLSEESCNNGHNEIEANLLAMFIQILISILCAAVGTVIAILVITWFTVKKFKRSWRYQQI